MRKNRKNVIKLLSIRPKTAIGKSERKKERQLSFLRQHANAITRNFQMVLSAIVNILRRKLGLTFFRITLQCRKKIVESLKKVIITLFKVWRSDFYTSWNQCKTYTISRLFNLSLTVRREIWGLFISYNFVSLDKYVMGAFVKLAVKS